MGNKETNQKNTPEKRTTYGESLGKSLNKPNAENLLTQITTNDNSSSSNSNK